MIIGGAFCFSNSPVLAQNEIIVEIQKPDVSTYPDLSIKFRAFSETGAFVKNLSLSSVHILENNQIIVPDILELREPGASVIVAVNEGATLAQSYAQIPRITTIKNAIINWIDTQSSTTMNDFSLVTNSGVVASQLTDPSEWTRTLTNYQPDMRKMQPGLSSLVSAVNLAIASKETESKTTTIFYITPLPDDDQIAALNELISQIKETNIRLFVWLIGPQVNASDEKTEVLRLAAQDTGGDYVFFSGSEELPSLSSYFDPLSFIYYAEYRSKIVTSGEFPLSINIEKGENVLKSESVSFTLNVLPPNPIFLSPPARVERTWTITEKKSDSVLTPDSVPLQIMIEFPDGYERNLIFSRLFVDNQLVDENTSEPFELFTWDIRSITESGSHVMSVSIQDTAGFVVETLELPVEVTVSPKPQTWIEKLLSSFSVPSIGLFLIVILAGFLLVVIAIRSLKKHQSINQSNKHKHEDPLTQPVIMEDIFIHPEQRAKNKNEWPHIPGFGLASARLLLQSVTKYGSDIPREIPLGDINLTFGSDPKLAKIIIPCASVSPLHARIAIEDQNQFALFDEGSGSGTWINYAPVSQQYGAKLEHGDLVQFGIIAYLFEIQGSVPRRLTVEPYTEEK